MHKSRSDTQPRFHVLKQLVPSVDGLLEKTTDRSTPSTTRTFESGFWRFEQENGCSAFTFVVSAQEAAVAETHRVAITEITVFLFLMNSSEIIMGTNGKYGNIIPGNINAGGFRVSLCGDASHVAGVHERTCARLARLALHCGVSQDVFATTESRVMPECRPHVHAMHFHNKSDGPAARLHRGSPQMTRFFSRRW